MTTPGLAGLPVVWSEDCLRHEPAGEVWLGVWEQGTEVPERATVLLAALAAAGAAVTDARPHADDALLAVHDAELVEHLLDDLGPSGRPAAMSASTGGPGWFRTCSPRPGCSAGCRCARRPRRTVGPASSATTP